MKSNDPLPLPPVKKFVLRIIFLWSVTNFSPNFFAFSNVCVNDLFTNSLLNFLKFKICTWNFPPKIKFEFQAKRNCSCSTTTRCAFKTATYNKIQITNSTQSQKSKSTWCYTIPQVNCTSVMNAHENSKSWSIHTSSHHNPSININMYSHQDIKISIKILLIHSVRNMTANNSFTQRVRISVQ